MVVFYEILKGPSFAISMPAVTAKAILFTIEIQFTMAFSKQHLYRQDTQIASATFKALSYSGRLEILFKLYSEGPLCVQDLALGHPISREALSCHLKILRIAGLIIAEERFPYTFYSVDENNIDKAEEILIQFFAHLKQTSSPL